MKIEGHKRFVKFRERGDTNMSDDFSDDARSMACPEFSGDLEKQEAWMAGWDEARRRAEAKIEKERRAAFWAGIDAFQSGITDERLKISEEWKDEAYRAWRAQREDGK